jgi:flagellar basal-body rod protein FlgC
MSFWSTLRIGQSAMSAQRLRLDIIANNIANAETTRTEEGGPYQRKDIVFAPKGGNKSIPQFYLSQSSSTSAISQGLGGVKVDRIVSSDEAGQKVHDPTHPDADEEGYVSYPNVNIVVEMTNMLSATRSYEASLTVIEAAKRMALRSIEIGR